MLDGKNYYYFTCNYSTVFRYMLLVELPLFARSGLGMDMNTITIMSSVPFFANWIFSVVYSKSLDTARAKV